MTSQPSKITIREFNPNVIADRVSTQASHGDGLRLVFVGASGVGKSTAITHILNVVRPFIPCGIAMSGSEKRNHAYNRMFPDLFIYEEYNEDALSRLEKRQEHACENLKNPWVVCVIDDCTESPTVFRTPLQHRLFKYGRHSQMVYILSLQYALDVPPAIRTCIDYTFIYRDPNSNNRKKLYDNFAGIIPDYSLFCELMDKLTADYRCLVIHNNIKSNNWYDCVYYWKADNKIKPFKFGAPEIWKFHEDRYDKNVK